MENQNSSENQVSSSSFLNLNNYSEFLQSVDGKPGRYICPVCDGNNLTASKDGVYTCWSDQSPAHRAEIRKAILKLAGEWKGYDSSQKSTNPKVIVTPEIPQATDINTTEIKLARLSECPPITDSESIGNFTPKGGIERTEQKKTVYAYSHEQRIIRTDFICNGKRDKFFIHQSIKSGKWENGQGPEHWHAYGHRDIYDLPQAGGGNAILMVEGEKSVDHVRHHLGLAAVSLRIWNKDHIEQFSKDLTDTGITTVIFPYDNDDTGLKNADLVAKILSDKYRVIPLDLTELYPLPDKGDMVEAIMSSQGQGWNQEEFITRLEQLIHATAIEKESIEEKRKQLNQNKAGRKTAEDIYEYNKLVRLRASQASSKSEKEAILSDLDKSLPTNVEHYFKLKEHAGGRIKWNELDMCIEIDGIPANPDTLVLDVNKALVFDVLDEQALFKVAHDNAYNPFKEHLSKCSETHKNNLDPTFLDKLSSTLLGSKTDIENIYLKKQLIAAIARTYKPGCKKDETLILKGSQGNLKSSFLKALYGERFFTDDMSDCSEKDQLMKMNKFPGLELAEIEQYLNKKDISKTKSFLSTATDAYRVPYGRTVMIHPRKGVIWGTTNEPSFLADATGNRRFWVIETGKTININWVTEHQEMIWAVAKHLYDSGEIWWLTNEERNLSNASNEQFSYSDPWTQAIEDYLRGRPCDDRELPFTTQDIVLNALKIEGIGRVDKAMGHRVKEIMQKLGYVYGNKWSKVLAKGTKGYYKKEVETIPQTVSYTVMEENRISAPLVDTLPDVGTWIEIYPHDIISDTYARKKVIVFVLEVNNPWIYWASLDGVSEGTHQVERELSCSEWQYLDKTKAAQEGLQKNRHFKFEEKNGIFVEKVRKNNSQTTS